MNHTVAVFNMQLEQATPLRRSHRQKIGRHAHSRRRRRSSPASATTAPRYRRRLSGEETSWRQTARKTAAAPAIPWHEKGGQGRPEL